MEAKATKKNLRGSERKMRLIIDMIRGKNVVEAISLLKFNPKHASDEALKVLLSAVSNLENKSEGGANRAAMIVKEAFVDKGPMLKRISPAPMGRAYRIRKRMNHVTIIVSTTN